LARRSQIRAPVSSIVHRRHTVLLVMAETISDVSVGKYVLWLLLLGREGLVGERKSVAAVVDIGVQWSQNWSMGNLFLTNE